MVSAGARRAVAIGSRYLLDLADVCRRTGYQVIEVGASANQQGGQWKYRARRSGGYDNGRPNHIMAHHTASGPHADGWPDVNYMLFNPNNSARPTANLYLARKAVIYVMAGGATNTNGAGIDPCGVVQRDSMNTAAIAIEAGNNGIGEVWPEPQLDCYIKLCFELEVAYGIPNSGLHSHFEYAPARKVDPAGPKKYASAAAKWDMGRFRNDVAALYQPIPTPTPPPEDDDMPRYIYGLKDYANTWSQEGIHLSGDAFDKMIADGAILIRSDFHGQHIKSLMAVSGLVDADLVPLT